MIQLIQNEGKSMTFDDEQLQTLQQTSNYAQQVSKIKGKTLYAPNSINQQRTQTSMKDLYLLWNYIRGQKQNSNIISKQVQVSPQKIIIQNNQKIIPKVIPPLEKSQSQIFKKRKSISNQWIINQQINQQNIDNSKILNTSPDKYQNFKQYMEKTKLKNDDSADKQLTPSPLIQTESTMCQQRKRVQSQDSFETILKSQQKQMNSDKEAKSGRYSRRSSSIISSNMRRSSSQELSPIKSQIKLKQYRQKYIHHLGMLLSNQTYQNIRSQQPRLTKENMMEYQITKARILNIDLN